MKFKEIHLDEEKVKFLVEHIEDAIGEAKYEYEKYGRTQWYKRCSDRINGMCNILNILFDYKKHISWDIEGLKIEDKEG